MYFWIQINAHYMYVGMQQWPSATPRLIGETENDQTAVQIKMMFIRCLLYVLFLEKG